MTRKQHDLWIEAMGGLSAGIVGTVIGYPLDLVKTRMQTSLKQGTGGGIWSVGRTIVQNEGALALYKGMVPPLISLSILNTINFTSYSFVRTIYGAERGWDVRNGLAGATAGPLMAVVSTVENFVKTQMQMDNISAKQYRTSFHCVRSLVSSHGPIILYTGHSVNTLREFAFLGTYFFAYEGVRELLLEGSFGVKIPSALAIPLAGGCSGALAWFASFPLDCIRAGVQGQPVANVPIPAGSGAGAASGSVPRHVPLGAVEVGRSLWKRKGLRGLYAGVTPSIARAFLVSGSRFSAYEMAIWCLTGKRYHDDEDDP